MRLKGVENKCKSRTEFSFENVIMTGAYCKIREKLADLTEIVKNGSTDLISRYVLKSETKQSVGME